MPALQYCVLSEVTSTTFAPPIGEMCYPAAKYFIFLLKGRATAVRGILPSFRSFQDINHEQVKELPSWGKIGIRSQSYIKVIKTPAVCHHRLIRKVVKVSSQIVMYRSILLATALAAGVARWQQVGTQPTETHPSMTWQKCSSAGSCTTVNGKVVIDSNWRWLHDKSSGSTKNCYDGNKWDATLCPSNAKCAANCALEGADYSATYGATASGNSLKLGTVD